MAEWETSRTHHVSEAVFPAFDMINHVMLHTGQGTQLALVMRLDQFTGAAVFPDVLKTCRHQVITEASFICNLK